MARKLTQVKRKKPDSSTGGWLATLIAILKIFNVAKADGTTASDTTIDMRHKTLVAGFRLLRKLDFRLDDVRSFNGRHMQALVDQWVKEGKSPSSLVNRISVFRLFAGWIGKAGMVLPPERYVSDPALVQRSSIATTDKSWATQGVDVAAKIEAIRAFDPNVAMALELEDAFALRAGEALKMRPHLADMGILLDVSRGTKGGKQRFVTITTDKQRDVLDRAKAFVSHRDESIAGPVTKRNYQQVRNRYNYVVRKFGITRENGITGHGLRHGAANDYFEEVAGYPSPVRGGPVPSDAATERFARLSTAEMLGHSRPGATTHYCGRKRGSKKK